MRAPTTSTSRDMQFFLLEGCEVYATPRGSPSLDFLNSGPLFDAKPIHACPDLVTPLHLRIPRRERVEEGPVAAAEVTDTDGAVGVGDDLEMFAREKLVGNLDMTFSSDHQTRCRDLELLTDERTIDAHEQVALGSSVLDGLALECPDH